MRPNGLLVRARRVGVVAAVGLLAGLGSGLFGSGVAAAATVTKTLNYTCEFPLIGPGPLSVAIKVTFPNSGVVNQPIQATGFSATVTVPADTVDVLRLLDGATVEGSAAANVRVTDGAGTSQAVAIPNLNVPVTAVPPTGDMVVVASGPVPAFTVTHAGNAAINVGDFTSDLLPKKADGSLTELGPLHLDCVVDAGQNTLLTSIPVAASAPLATEPRR
ncbi:DUF6801 domain-containing protein [Goodfellowiella coeruleoviolacea]|uniref:DUF6801 domain-containing protein n=1 Tax=Goodfellowiella coeruleoviolacea TaxID=334858 RepID=A0AAE3KP10_9PSEU|nr:DUF6801 domain-containing protein [Goodfellowiella coeruleoviolacea]MCP2169313.1 hypothetical protein [Goodfellowiella coeruleoviolacea]